MPMPPSPRPNPVGSPCSWTSAPRPPEGHALGWKPNPIPTPKPPILLTTTSFPSKFTSRKILLAFTDLMHYGRLRCLFSIRMAKSSSVLKDISRRMNFARTSRWDSRESLLRKNAWGDAEKRYGDIAQNIRTRLPRQKPSTGRPLAITKERTTTPRWARWWKS